MRRVFTLSFIAVLLCSIYYAFVFGIAQLHYYNVKNSLDFWRKNPELLRLKDVDENLERINSAVALMPDNPLYYQSRGQVFEWKAIVDKQNSVLLLQEAMQNYQTSLAYRPLWAPTWINLASVKWKLGELDEEFKQYLEKAIITGPQQASVHKFIVKFGLAHYRARSSGYVLVYKQLPKHLALGLRNPLSERDILQSINTYQLQDFACRLLEGEPPRIRSKIKGCR